MKVEAIGIIGYGHFGQFVHTLVERFLSEVEVRVYDKEGDGDAAATSLEVAAASDIVFLSVPINEYDTLIDDIVQFISDTTVLVDVATVKKYTSELFREKLAGRSWLSCHPMFGPESYEKENHDVTGFRIVITDHTLPSDMYEGLTALLSRLGFLVIEMSADEHDKLLAETLFLTHYVGQTMKAGKFGRTKVDTVSFSSLMNAVEAVAHDDQLFADVYKYNPYCEEVAKRFHDAQDRVFAGIRKETK